MNNLSDVNFRYFFCIFFLIHEKISDDDFGSLKKCEPKNLQILILILIHTSLDKSPL